MLKIRFPRFSPNIFRFPPSKQREGSSSLSSPLDTPLVYDPVQLLLFFMIRTNESFNEPAVFLLFFNNLRFNLFLLLVRFHRPINFRTIALSLETSESCKQRFISKPYIVVEVFSFETTTTLNAVYINCVLVKTNFFLSLSSLLFLFCQHSLSG